MNPAMARPEDYEGRNYWAGVGEIVVHLAVPLLMSLGVWALIIWGIGRVAGVIR